jgi:hypothetical protein
MILAKLGHNINNWFIVIVALNWILILLDLKYNGKQLVH